MSCNFVNSLRREHLSRDLNGVVGGGQELLNEWMNEETNEEAGRE